MWRDIHIARANSMKTSVLIQKLMEIDKTVLFDADVVTGEGWWLTPIPRVYHNPPILLSNLKQANNPRMTLMN